MKKAIRLAFCLMALMVATGADAKVEKSELLGIWTQTINEHGVNIVSTYDFKDDNTATQIFVMNGTNPKINIIADGTVSYTLSADTLTFKFAGSDINFTLFEIEGLPDESIDMAKKQMTAQMANLVQKLTDVNIEGNTMTAKFNGETITLQRK